MMSVSALFSAGGLGDGSELFSFSAADSSPSPSSAQSRAPISISRAHPTAFSAHIPDYGVALFPAPPAAAALKWANYASQAFDQVRSAVSAQYLAAAKANEYAAIAKQAARMSANQNSMKEHVAAAAVAKTLGLFGDPVGVPTPNAFGEIAPAPGPYAFNAPNPLPTVEASRL